jgi:mono/diheme cytochrome c family protein
MDEPQDMMQFHSLRTCIKAVLASVAVYLPLAGTASAAEIPSGKPGFESHIKPFFRTHCVKCHGPEKSKGKITLHSLDGDLAAGQELERWELILDVLKAGEMPPEEEPVRPAKVEVAAVTQWIESGLRDYVKKASRDAGATTTRRLTNFEYQNTMRDLLGFELELAKDLPVDPDKPYHFNNTAAMMMIGPDQLVRYKEAARKVGTWTTRQRRIDPGRDRRLSRAWRRAENCRLEKLAQDR